MESKLKIKDKTKIVLYGPNGAGKSTLIHAVLEKALTGKQTEVADVDVEPKSAFLITESVVKQFGVKVFRPDEITFVDWNGVAVIDPTVARRLSLEVYCDKFYDPDRGWAPLSSLSYGQKRQLAIEAALGVAEFIAVENFEAGLHADVISNIIKLISETEATVILETHSAYVLKLALRQGLTAYYVEPYMLRRIERLDDIHMFSRELSAYNAIVV